ncbi:hypothetical protein [Prescottella equi]|uniref:hypothetical protein n=1 Tax=Rhodococcus hoagii TaxID=43767 RepID=UPI00351BE7B8
MPEPEHFDDATRNDPDVVRLARPVRLQPAPDDAFPMTGTRLEIRTNDGESVTGRVDSPWGGSSRRPRRS